LQWSCMEEMLKELRIVLKNSLFKTLITLLSCLDLKLSNVKKESVY
jgi:hypothetical protein